MPNLIQKARTNRLAAVAALAERKTDRDHDDIPRVKFALEDEINNLFT